MDLFYNIDADVMVLGLLFVIFFALTNLALNRTLKNRGTASVVAFCVSLLAVFGISRTNWSASGLFYNIGMSDKVLYTVVPILILAGLIFMVWKLKLARALFFTGLFLIILSFFAYEKMILLIIGIVLLIVGLFLWFRKGRVKKNAPDEVRRETEKGENLRKKRREGIHTLKREARKFNDWAKKQDNPKFYGTWAYFISYLYNKRGYPKGEAAICEKLGISQSDFVNIFNKYGLVN